MRSIHILDCPCPSKRISCGLVYAHYVRALWQHMAASSLAHSRLSQLQLRCLPARLFWTSCTTTDQPSLPATSTAASSCSEKQQAEAEKGGRNPWENHPALNSYNPRRPQALLNRWTSRTQAREKPTNQCISQKEGQNLISESPLLIELEGLRITRSRGRCRA